MIQTGKTFKADAKAQKNAAKQSKQRAEGHPNSFVPLPSGYNNSSQHYLQSNAGGQFGSPTRHFQHDTAKGNANFITPYNMQSAGAFFDDNTMSTPVGGSNTRNKRSRAEFVIPIEVIDDICARFPLTIAGDAVTDEEALHLLFVVEECYWFYLDYACADNAALHTVDFETFARQVFERYSKLGRFLRNFSALHRDWLKYKRKIPVHGAVLIDTKLEALVLVRQINSRGWFFPKGKINEGESPRECAAREVLEECGIDCSALIDESEYVFIPGGHAHASSAMEDDQADGNIDRSRLFLVAGVPRDAPLVTRTRNEIAKIEWFSIDELHRAAHSGESNLEFIRVNRLLPQIEQFVARKRAQRSVDALRSAGRTQTTPFRLPGISTSSDSSNHVQQAANGADERSTTERYTALYSQSSGQSAALSGPDALFQVLLGKKAPTAAAAAAATQSTSTSIHQNQNQNQIQNQQFLAPSWCKPHLDSQQIVAAFKLAVQ